MDIGYNIRAGRYTILEGNRGEGPIGWISLSLIAVIFPLSLRLLEEDYIKVLCVC